MIYETAKVINSENLIKPPGLKMVKGTSEKILMLLEFGAEVNLKNSIGNNAWAYAQENYALSETEGFYALKEATLDQTSP